MTGRSKKSNSQNTNNKQKIQDLQERIRFEKLLCALSATFIDLPSYAIDEEIEHGLELISRFLGSDRTILLQFTEDEKTLNVTHFYIAPGIEPLPGTVVNPDQRPLWYTETLKNGETIMLENLPDDLPENAWAERQFCIEQGIKSHLTIPLSMGKVLPKGAIVLAFIRKRKSLQMKILSQVKLIGQVLTFALMRKQTENELRDALIEIKELKRRLESEITEEIKTDYSYGEILGHSNAIKTVMSLAEKVAPTDSTVLIQGETGTGKELLARAIHSLSPRNKKPIVKVNCSAIPSTLIESELFGREKGAYTGALAKQIGRFELADGGTIFLDEIGELPLELQAKLLHVIEKGQFERLGSPETIKVDIRVIAATNIDLASAVQNSKFRKDLYYRLKVFPIEIPPLRQRQEDIPILVWAFVQEFSDKMGKTIKTIPDGTMKELQSYSWPGNVRELRNVIEHAMILTKDNSLKVEIPEPIVDFTKRQDMALDEFEKSHITDILKMTGWKVRGKNGAAEILQLKPSTLESKMQRLGIKRPD